MIRLGQHIQYLLTRHDCVIVPDWGAFIVHYSPASIITETNVVTPPAKSITFNPAVSHNDGLLAGSLMRRHGISYDLACQKIEDEVDTMKHLLAANNEMNIEGVGRFEAVEGGTPRFEPALNNIATIRYNILQPIEIHPVIEVARREASVPVAGKVISPFTRFRQVALRVAASVAVLVAVAGILMVPVGPENRSLLSMASLINFSSEDGSTNNRPEDFNATTVNLTISLPGDDSFANVNADERVAHRQELARQKALKESEASSTVGGTRLSENDTYCLVISSHSSMSEARRYIAMHGKKCPMKILNKDGRFRVYVASGNSMDQVRAIGSNPQIKGNFPDAWVCRQK